ncbi:MAG: hypothetical protein ACJ75J_00180 [Cytophagaceae bacterium]
MKALFDVKLFQTVICIKDNKSYVFNVDEHPGFVNEDYSLIRCFLVKESGHPDFTKAIEIYSKDLVDAD